MKLKHLAIAVAALGLFTIGMWFVRQQGKSYTVDPIIGTALVSGDTLNAARSIELFDGADVASVILMLQGNQWMIEEYYRLPIEFTRLRRLVTELGELKVIRAVTENPERMAALDLVMSSSCSETWTVLNWDASHLAGRGRPEASLPRHRNHLKRSL